MKRLVVLMVAIMAAVVVMAAPAMATKSDNPKPAEVGVWVYDDLNYDGAKQANEPLLKWVVTAAYRVDGSFYYAERLATPHHGAWFRLPLQYNPDWYNFWVEVDGRTVNWRAWDSIWALNSGYNPDIYIPTVPLL